jgi:hypothetical protein
MGAGSSLPRQFQLAPDEEISKSAAKLRLLKTFYCTTKYEKEAWQSGAQLVAGVDEVGRGLVLLVSNILFRQSPIFSRILAPYIYDWGIREPVFASARGTLG